MQQADVTSFIARANDGVFSSGLFISTAKHISSNALKALHRNPRLPVTRIDYSDFIQAPIDWDAYLRNKEAGRQEEELTVLPKKELRPHQQEAVLKTLEGFKTQERGKLVMACGTGKTFTALKLAEQVSERSEGSHALVLFMVPSLALMSQSITEFAEQTSLPLRVFAVCSDTKVGKRVGNADEVPEHIEDMKVPATTSPDRLYQGWEQTRLDEGLTVVFATYQSIETVHQAQALGLPDFDLIICDEAHRTAGSKLASAEESHFTKIHHQDYIAGAKRLYMTATPKVYSDTAKDSASENDALLFSMDNPEQFGETFYYIGFGKAVELGLLTDYKVLVFGVSEDQVTAGFQGILANQNKELKVNDVAKLIGCWSSLAKRSSDLTAVDFGVDTAPMRRAVAFSRSIKDSKAVTEEFPHVVDQLVDLTNEDPTDDLGIEIQHIDGGFGALERNRLLDWLKEEKNEVSPTCRILSNARCLTEGVDIPNLDAVMFLNPRNSQVDIIQAVGRVMRRSPGKQYGYIILPIVVPAGATAESSLNDNESYRTIWQVVQALRAHDERLGNDLEVSRLDGKLPEQIKIDFIDLSPASRGKGDSIGEPGADEAAGSESASKYLDGVQGSFTFPVDAWKEGLYTRVVEKCGDRFYWADWTKSIGDITHRTIAQIRTMLDESGDTGELRLAFEAFVVGLQATLNPTVDEEQAVELLAQHMVTRPVFEKLFAGHRFTLENPISQAMQSVVEFFLQNPAFARELEGLQTVYDRVSAKVERVETAGGKQGIIKEIYDNFFRSAFPKTADRLGIVFTPVEVVDYILRSADVALQRHFGKRLSDRGVSILEPFAGTGTFITRLLQLGLIRPEDLRYKFSQEIFANELVMLSYYIAAINIETVFAEEAQKAGLGLDYLPFEGMVLTDTFQLTESRSQLSNESVFAQNSKRAQRELDTAIEVIVMNPPYSAGQESANDDNKRPEYKILNNSIEETYSKLSSGSTRNKLYDSYIEGYS